MEKLLTDATANVGTPTDISDSNVMVTANITAALGSVIQAFGNFGGARIKVYMSLNGISDPDDPHSGAELLPGMEFVVSSTNLVIMALPAGITVWAELEDAGVDTDLNLWIAGQGRD